MSSGVDGFHQRFQMNAWEEMKDEVDQAWQSLQQQYQDVKASIEQQLK